MKNFNREWEFQLAASPHRSVAVQRRAFGYTVKNIGLEIGRDAAGAIDSRLLRRVVSSKVWCVMTGDLEIEHIEYRVAVQINIRSVHRDGSMGRWERLEASSRARGVMVDKPRVKGLAVCVIDERRAHAAARAQRRRSWLKKKLEEALGGTFRR